MGKFKVGDKVSYKDEHVNGVGTVHEYEGSGMYLVKVESKDDGLAYFVNNTCREFREKDLSSVASSWRPKVGDKVRWLGKFDAVMYTKGNVYEIHGSKYSSLLVTDDRKNMDHTWDSLKIVENFELVTGITIEAGKFYKSRDGRKVGPSKVSEWPNGDWKWSLGQLWLFKDDGTSGGTDRQNDLIAEWVDEPVAATAKASNDNAEPTLGDILQAAIGKRVTVKVEKPKFKVGDRVKSVEEGITKGLMGTILEDDGTSVSFLIKFDDWSDGHGKGDDEYWLMSTDVVLAPANPAIVCLIENGQPKPAIYPHVHADEGAASKEASRLASVHKGQKFGVYVLTQTVSEEKVYSHEWQNLAIKGEKISAIKALRAANDLTLKGAKDAVEHWLELNAA